MAPQMGRPKIENPKNIDVKVRFDEKTNNKLLEYCEKHSITRAEAIREAVENLLSEK